MKIVNIFIIFILICGCKDVTAIFEFPQNVKEIPAEDLRSLLNIKRTYLTTAVQMGVESIEHHESLEENLIHSNIVVANGSTAYAQYLETFPNEETRAEDKVAREILKSSLYILNAKCLPQDIKSQSCADYFSDVSLPESDLRLKCLRINHSYPKHGGHKAFRRLLPAKYKDGFEKMYTHLPRPREITNLGLFGQSNSIHSGNNAKDDQKNLILVQWAQFIEHDLSKSVVTTMKNGAAIDCCDSNYYQLSPRHIHPACAALVGLAPEYKFGPISCLSYVRSALAVDPNCRFGAATQLNQATGLLDLSQLYGFIPATETMMRLFRNGLLKYSGDESPNMSFLPLAENRHDYCVETTNPNCFMAGDSRVNSNPFMTFIYTIFLRNHNLYAEQIHNSNPNWSDEQIYQHAKKLNIEMYRDIVFNEWLPLILGGQITDQINSETVTEPLTKQQEFNMLGTSNEFGIAAIRFYFSMLPNALEQTNTAPAHAQFNDNYHNLILNHENIMKMRNLSQNVFTMSEEYYKSDFLSQPEKLTLALNAMFNQKAMKMDSNYAECLTKKFLSTNKSAAKISGSDALAWDIQRGRDHGLQGYIKYLEICTQTKIHNWLDLEQFIQHEGIAKLKNVYKSIEDIDLIVGGISEIPMNESTVGPTFNCILAEQFSNIRKWHLTLTSNNNNNESTKTPALPKLSSVQQTRNTTSNHNAAISLLCRTTTLISVPKNIFLAPSKLNPLVACADLIKQ